MMAIQERVHDHLWRSVLSCPDRFLCAIVDTARDPGIRRMLVEPDSDSWCLIDGDISLELSEAAPYLVVFEKGSVLLRTLIEQGWGHSWGIFMIARSPFEPLLDHLKSILTARLPEGGTVYFRYYDPRVLRLYLPTCTKNELNRFFGPVISCIMEDNVEGRSTEFRQRGEGTPCRRSWVEADDQSEEDRGASSGAPEPAIETTHYPSGLCQLFID